MHTIQVSENLIVHCRTGSLEICYKWFKCYFACSLPHRQLRKISGWHDNGDKANCFEQGKHLSKTVQIIAYMVVDPNDHD